MRPRQTWPAAPAFPSLTASLQLVLRGGDPLLLLGVGILEPIALAEHGFGHAEVGIELEGFAGHQGGDCRGSRPCVLIEQIALSLQIVIVSRGLIGAVVFQTRLLLRGEVAGAEP